ncbi:MAG: hypothetical protein M0Z27_08785 [Thermaerobacter sp.]|nr:hypothetical protein [Thermaerobacter sp.]
MAGLAVLAALVAACQLQERSSGSPALSLRQVYGWGAVTGRVAGVVPVGGLGRPIFLLNETAPAGAVRVVIGLRHPHDFRWSGGPVLWAVRSGPDGFWAVTGGPVGFRLCRWAAGAQRAAYSLGEHYAHPPGGLAVLRGRPWVATYARGNWALTRAAGSGLKRHPLPKAWRAGTTDLLGPVTVGDRVYLAQQPFLPGGAAFLDWYRPGAHRFDRAALPAGWFPVGLSALGGRALILLQKQQAAGGYQAVLLRWHRPLAFRGLAPVSGHLYGGLPGPAGQLLLTAGRAGRSRVLAITSRGMRQSGPVAGGLALFETGQGIMAAGDAGVYALGG